MKYQTMPPLSEADEIALEKSIRTFGIQVPIIVDENGDVIDGHHRKAIAERIGAEVPTERRTKLTEAEKVALSISLNVDRRQLTREQRREIIAASVKAAPEQTNREHARRVGADDKTVATVRRDLEKSAEIPHISERVDPRTGNASQPASKPDRPVVSITTRKSESLTETFDPATGEQIEMDEGISIPVIQAALNADPTVQDKKYMHEFYKAIVKAGEYQQFDAERIGRLAQPRDFRTLELEVEGAQRFLDKMRNATGLRVIGGNR